MLPAGLVRFCDGPANSVKGYFLFLVNDNHPLL
jgi:hypothetical protein